MKVVEWIGVVLAVVYSLLIAANIGWEVPAFVLLLLSSGLFMVLAVNKKLYGMLALQIFYTAAAIFGIINWL